MAKGKIIVRKSNNYVLSKYALNTNEQKIILLCISKIKQKQVELDTELEFSLTAAEIKDFLGFNSHRLYEELHSIAINLANSIVDIQVNGTFDVYSPFPDTSYANGVFNIKFNKKLNPELIDLAGNFTQYALDNVKALKNNYSLRLYEILKSYQYQNQLKIDLNELKSMLGILTTDKKGKPIVDKYKKYADFKRRVLIVAQNEIAANTDLEFQYEEIKVGRKVSQVLFYINKNHLLIEEKVKPTNEIMDVKDQISFDFDLFQRIDECRIFLPNDVSTSAIQQLLSLADNNVSLIEEKFLLSKQQKKIDNIVGWLIKAISEDYQAISVEGKSTNRFNNFPQRNYSKKDYENMEQALLNKYLNK